MAEPKLLPLRQFSRARGRRAALAAPRLCPSSAAGDDTSVQNSHGCPAQASPLVRQQLRRRRDVRGARAAAVPSRGPGAESRRGRRVRRRRGRRRVLLLPPGRRRTRRNEEARRATSVARGAAVGFRHRQGTVGGGQVDTTCSPTVTTPRTARWVNLPVAFPRQYPAVSFTSYLYFPYL